MFRCFYPDRREESAYTVPYQAYFEKGVRGVIFDIDNTLVPHGAPADQRAMDLFGRLHHMGMAVCLLSNNKEPRVSSFARQVKSPYIFKGGKPGASGYRKAMAKMGTDPGTTLFVGDQLFTDIYGARRLGIRTVLVRPLDPREEIQIVLKRFLEKPVLACYEHDRKKRTEGRTHP